MNGFEIRKGDIFVEGDIDLSVLGLETGRDHQGHDRKREEMRSKD